MPARQRGGKLWDERELRGRSGESLRDGDEGVVPDDAERGLILLRREHLAPAVQLTQRRERARRERSGPLHPQERVGGVRRAGPAQGFEGRELFLRPGEAAELCETVSQRVPQGRQVLGVRRRVLEHRGRQRPSRPVRFLMLLRELHPHVLLEQRGQPHRRLASELGGDARVEDPRRAEPVIPVQNAQDRKSTRLNSSHTVISYAVFCLKKKKKKKDNT